MKEILEITDLKDMINKTRSLYANKIVTRKWIGKLKHLISMDLEEHQDGIYSEKELIKTGTKLIEKGDRSFIDATINPNEMNITKRRKRKK